MEKLNAMIVIGVTGHRVLAEREKIQAGIQRALLRIRGAFAGELTVLSALAEGADRLVALQARDSVGAGLIAVLPLPLGDYMADFESAASRAEFHHLLATATEVIELEPAATRAESYSRVGEYILDRSDMLLAVWDGQAPQDTGGTSEVVNRARARRIPLAWVMAGNRVPGTLEATSLGARQGDVVFENL